jgi:hypothetical protein
VFCLPLLVLLSFFFWPLWFLFFDYPFVYVQPLLNMNTIINISK